MEYLRRTSNYPKRITLSDPTHMMSIADLVAIGMEILRINSVGDLWKKSSPNWSIWIPEFYYTLLSIRFFMSWLGMWSFDLRHQRHLVDVWPCFDYGWWIPSNMISKTSYIGYDMKSSKIIMWSRWDHSPSQFEVIDSKNEMQWNPWPQ